ncbi:MAG: GlxA family transcriptional regulator [Proteobacteria bacterium]|nr:GlxA family transcriptional regulator [Pseudomonadota bacterium]
MRKLALLLLPEFSNFGLAAVTEPLFVANWLAQDTVFEWRTISDDGKPVRASNGTVVPVDGDLTLAAGCASLFILASFDPARTARNRARTRWLKRIAATGVELVGIENGSLALAEAGLLNQHAAAVHWDNLAGFQELFPAIRIAQPLFSFSGNRVTCAGAAAILDMMIAWIAQHADVQTSAEVGRHLLLGARRDLRHGDSASSADPLVARARAIMQAHVDDPLPCDAIAQQLGLSLRQLERRFKQQPGQTLHSEYMLVRVEKAHQYLQQTTLSVTEVAVLTGFTSVEYFSKVYRRVFGVLPSKDRRQSTDAPVFRRKAAGKHGYK